MQMTPASFWHEYTFADYQRKTFFFFRNKEDSLKTSWEQTRRLGYIVAKVAGADVEPIDIMEFAWDKKKRVAKLKPMSKKEIDDTLNYYKQNGMLN